MAQLERLKYSCILKWEKDGLIFQKELRKKTLGVYPGIPPTRSAT